MKYLKGLMGMLKQNRANRVISCFHLALFLWFIYVSVSREWTGKPKKKELADCVYRQTNDIQRKLPLFLRGNKFLLPNHRRVTVKHNDYINLLCPYPDSVLTKSFEHLTSVQCDDGKLICRNSKFDFDQFRCSEIVKEAVVATNETCGKKWKYFKIGYYIRANELLILYKVCHDDVNGNSYRASYFIYGDSTENSLSSNEGFSDIFIRMNMTVAYSIINQQQAFMRYLKKDDYINKDNYLVPTQLAPDADFYYYQWKYSTYLYINTSPQYKSINEGNWVTVENVVRKFASVAKRRLKVITGTLGILKLPNDMGKRRGVFLFNTQKMRVPQFFWKILYDENKEAAITFIVTNDPFGLSITVKEYICQSICEKNGWAHRNWDRVKHGVVHCCAFNTFAKALKSPPNIKATKVLKSNFKLYSGVNCNPSKSIDFVLLALTIVNLI